MYHSDFLLTFIISLLVLGYGAVALIEWNQQRQDRTYEEAYRKATSRFQDVLDDVMDETVDTMAYHLSRRYKEDTDADAQSVE